MNRRTLLSGLLGLLPAGLVPKALRASPVQEIEAQNFSWFAWATYGRDGEIICQTDDGLRYWPSPDTIQELINAGLMHINPVINAKTHTLTIWGDLPLGYLGELIPVRIRHVNDPFSPFRDRWQARTRDGHPWAAVSCYGLTPAAALLELKGFLSEES